MADLRPSARDLLMLGAAFSRIMYGAVILSNVCVSRLLEGRENATQILDNHLASFGVWADTLNPADVDLLTRRISELSLFGSMTRHRIDEKAIAFVTRWTRYCQEPSKILGDQAANRLVSDREVFLKSAGGTSPNPVAESQGALGRKNRAARWTIDGSRRAAASTTWQPRQMLEPQGRLSIYDIVRPPTGFVLDCLVATTCTASLDTVLSLPAAMLADIPGIGRRTASIFTATELAALRRVCDRTAIFCRGAAIHPASDLPSAVIEAETMVHEVLAPNKGTFHPKVWVMQFKHRENQRAALRVVVMSRNITEDRSWDAGLVLDSKPSPGAEKPNDLGLLLRSLAGLCIRPLDQTRRDL